MDTYTEQLKRRMESDPKDYTAVQAYLHQLRRRGETIKQPEQVSKFLEGYAWYDVFKEAGHNIDDVFHIIAYEEGENDVSNWTMVYVSNEGSFGYVTAGCDFTGFD